SVRIGVFVPDTTLCFVNGAVPQLSAADKCPQHVLGICLRLWLRDFIHGEELLRCRTGRSDNWGSCCCDFKDAAGAHTRRVNHRIDIEEYLVVFVRREQVPIWERTDDSLS